MTRLGLASARFSLRIRLTVFAAVAAAVVLAVGALLLYGGLASALDDAVTGELRVRAEDVVVEAGEGAPLPTGSGLITQVLTDDGRVLDPPGEAPIASVAEIRAAGSELVVDRPIAGIGSQARLLLRPVRLGDGTPAVVAVAGSTGPVERAQDRLVVVLGVAGPVMVVVVAAMAWVLTGAALRPVARMTRRAATISLREPDARLPQPPGRDEIAQLAATLNAMLDRIAETMAHERAFVDDASHELRSPLAVLRTELELARLELSDQHDTAEMRQTLDSSLEETDRLIALTERLLVLARADTGRLVGPPEAVVLDDLLCRVLDRIDTGELAVELRGHGAVAFADPLAVAQLVTNLITNAARWARKRVLVEAAADGDAVVILVADDGPGFNAGILARAFDRFSRADPARGRSGGGTGLGLAIVAAITEALAGQTTARNGHPLGGAVVEVRLPAAPATDRA